MKIIESYCRDVFHSAWNGWNRFWFAPRDPATLGLIRIFTGLMLLYSHAVWTVDWNGFFGPQGWLSPAARLARFNLPPDLPPDAELPAQLNFSWTHFNWIDDPSTLWAIHLLGFAVYAALTVGFCSRSAAVLAWLLTISYLHRNPLALFGFDAIITMVAMYLMIGAGGAAFSLDQWLKRFRQRGRGGEQPSGGIEKSVSANLSIRLIQCHMCLIYLFSALGKIQGETWWNGRAIWGAAGNLEYQSWDAVWLAQYPELGNLITHTTVVWELSYCVLIWPRLWRPLMLAMAVGIHLGIGLWMGMMTFGLAMLIGNLAFIEPQLIRRCLGSATTKSVPG